MDPSPYKYNALAFWMDHYHFDDAMSEDGLEEMAEELDGLAQDAASYWMDNGEVPWLCAEIHLEQWEKMRSACLALVECWDNGTPVHPGSEVADQVRAALAWGTQGTTEGRSE